MGGELRKKVRWFKRVASAEEGKRALRQDGCRMAAEMLNRNGLGDARLRLFSFGPPFAELLLTATPAKGAPRATAADIAALLPLEA
jgi:hypothetical protein